MSLVRHHMFGLGQTVRLSERGRARIRTIDPHQNGVVIGLSLTGNACRIQFPCRKSAMTLHVSYIENVDFSPLEFG